MAISATPRRTTRRLAGFGLTTPDADALARFYETASGARRLSAGTLSGPAFKTLMNVECSAKRILLAIGSEQIELLQFGQPGEPYPQDTASSDLVFQHFAIVVADMQAAYGRLVAAKGWSLISTGGPVVLPQSSGGVTAFKFRDPDGHPLELLAFPAGQKPGIWTKGSTDLCLGIDHSAISIFDTQRSIAFYQNLGFEVTAQTINTGISQQKLDAVADPHVEVTALSAMEPAPHLELLCYRAAEPRARRVLRNNDAAATRLYFETSDDMSQADTMRCVQDPDGHHLVLISSLKDDIDSHDADRSSSLFPSQAGATQ